MWLVLCLIDSHASWTDVEHPGRQHHRFGDPTKKSPALWQWALHPPVWEPALPPCSFSWGLPVRWVLPTLGSQDPICAQETIHSVQCWEIFTSCIYKHSLCLITCLLLPPHVWVNLFQSEDSLSSFSPFPKLKHERLLSRPSASQSSSPLAASPPCREHWGPLETFIHTSACRLPSQLRHTVPTFLLNFGKPKMIKIIFVSQ